MASKSFQRLLKAFSQSARHLTSDRQWISIRRNSSIATFTLKTKGVSPLCTVTRLTTLQQRRLYRQPRQQHPLWNPSTLQHLPLKQPLQLLSTAPEPRVSSACDVTFHEDHVMLTLPDATQVPLHYIWLRDHCRCAECFNFSTNQRSLEIDDVDVDIRPTDLKKGEEALTLTWPDGHVSHFDFSFLLQNGIAQKPGGNLTTWEKSDWLGGRALPVVAFEDFMQTDEGLRRHLSNLLEFGFAIVDGAEASPQGTRATSERLCFVQTTTFGDIWTFTADMARGDTAYTNLALGSHNDSTYLCYGTGIQVFHVMYHNGSGGETTLVDGFRAAEKLKSSDPSAYDALTSLPVGAEYVDAAAKLSYTDRIIKENPVTGELEQIRFNIYDRSPLNSIPSSKVPTFYRSLQSFAQVIKTPSMVLEVPLKPGQVLFVDNWRVLHGRRSFDGGRRVSGCYLPRDDWRSKARLLGCQL